MKALYPLFLLLLTVTAANAQNVRIVVHVAPKAKTAGESLYVAGSFNGWQPAAPLYRLQPDSNGVHFLALTLPPGNYEFKITRGRWDKSECREDGSSLANRLLRVEGAGTWDVPVTVEQWQDLVPKKSTASARVQILDTSFYMPQLKRSRRIWIYLPPGYDDSKKRYPVLYLHDGQNVFEDSTAYAGEWGVDEAMDSTALPAAIVVAIDHGGPSRIREYCPYPMAEYGKGEGGAYLRFLVKTLRPFIDKRFRTLRQRQHRYVAGSSMGGLISFYALLRYPKIFGGAGVFSPAFWIAPGLWKDISSRGKKVRARVYFAAGKSESETMVPLLMKAFSSMSRVSPSALRAVIRHEGKHNESFWRSEFPHFYAWLLGGR